MCGIVGFHGPGTLEILSAMTDRLVHRGPDDCGYFHHPDTSLFLGHRRLQIIDIAGGKQPMWDRSRTIGVVFNGEIYNHHALRQELTSLGHTFSSSHSDTETLIHGFRQWREELPKKLNGMFAFAIVDLKAQELFLARDRFGEKPLYYTVQGDVFAFASEINALLMHPQVCRQLSREGLMKFFAYNFFPAPHTPYAAIRKLKGGEFLLYDLAGKGYRTRTYWQFTVDPASPRSIPQWRDELRHLLQQAVQRRLESDVPLGFLLSGGIDSSAILALAGESLPRQQLKSFSMGFHEASYDESRYAQAMAREVGSEHVHQYLDFEQAFAEAPALLGRIGEPMGDSSILPTHAICRFAREKVTVALSGDGGDELFAGYDPFKALGASRLYHALMPRFLHAGVQRMADGLPVSQGNMGLDFKIRRWLRGVGEEARYWNPLWMGALDPRDMADLFGVTVHLEDVYSEGVAAWEGCASDHAVDRTQMFFARLYLQNGILWKTDQGSMLSSLELRAPFLDNDLVDFACRLPAQVKYRRGQGKWLLREALADVLPGWVLTRRKKGFGIPLQAWLRRWPAPAPGRFSTVMDEAWLGRAWRRHQAGEADYRHALWCWLAMGWSL